MEGRRTSQHYGLPFVCHSTIGMVRHACGTMRSGFLGMCKPNGRLGPGSCAVSPLSLLHCSFLSPCGRISVRLIVCLRDELAVCLVCLCVNSNVHQANPHVHQHHKQYDAGERVDLLG